jgi:hypothetical protein
LFIILLEKLRRNFVMHILHIISENYYQENLLQKLPQLVLYRLFIFANAIYIKNYKKVNIKNYCVRCSELLIGIILTVGSKSNGLSSSIILTIGSKSNELNSLRHYLCTSNVHVNSAHRRGSMWRR